MRYSRSRFGALWLCVSRLFLASIPWFILFGTGQWGFMMFIFPTIVDFGLAAMHVFLLFTCTNIRPSFGGFADESVFLDSIAE